MPFINLDIHTAREILEENGFNLLERLLRNGKINPHEFDVLVALREYSNVGDEQGKKNEAKNTLEDICKLHFPKEAQRAIKLLMKFSGSRRNVSWVLFSRTIQFIPFEEKNPLEGYKPKLNDILKTQIFETLKLKN